MLNKFAYIGAVMSVTVATAAFASDKAVPTFEESWTNPAYTPYEAPAADINEVLGRQADSQLLTGDHLWEAEKKKAWDPLTYIPHVVLEGESYDKSVGSEGEVVFMRRSRQRSWLDPNVIVPVLEEVHLFEKERKVIFLGKTVKVFDEDAPSQPLFHVEHSVGGTQENPLSLWRIIMLTSDARYVQAVDNIFKRNTGVLPSFVSAYLKHDLHLLEQ